MFTYWFLEISFHSCLSPLTLHLPLLWKTPRPPVWKDWFMTTIDFLFLSTWCPAPHDVLLHIVSCVTLSFCRVSFSLLWNETGSQICQVMVWLCFNRCIYNATCLILQSFHSWHQSWKIEGLIRCCWCHQTHTLILPYTCVCLCVSLSSCQHSWT